MAKVIVGMSGGVDSAVTALLLQQKGWDVIGVTLRTWESADGESSRCCEIDDARETCRLLGIRYYALNCLSLFHQKVIAPFMEDYRRGRTPNPCVGCNRDVKWGKLLNFADIMQAEYIATGHYASVVRTENGRYTVQKSKSAAKDQTYMLWQLTQEQLSRTIMPLGNYSKDEVRQLAREAGLNVAEKRDSQEICFVPDGDYAGFIQSNSGKATPCEGHFVDAYGHILGRHRGIIHYTVGQRKGLGIALGKPVYVSEIRPETNEVVLGNADSLLRNGIICRKLNWMGTDAPAAGVSLQAHIRIRYHDIGKAGKITQSGGDTVRVIFEKPVQAPAPGQSAVFYDASERVLGGGIIDATF